MNKEIKGKRVGHIVNSAETIFFEKGFAQASISDICKLANCSRTTLYSYFESKENIYLAVAEQSFRKFLQYFSDLSISGKTGLDRLLLMAKGYLDFSQQWPKNYQLILNFYGILKVIDNKVMQTELHQNLAKSPLFEKVRILSEIPLQILTAEIQAGQKDGSIATSIASEQHLINIWAYLRGLSDLSTDRNSIRILGKEVKDLEQYVINIMEKLLVD